MAYMSSHERLITWLKRVCVQERPLTVTAMLLERMSARAQSLAAVLMSTYANEHSWGSVLISSKRQSVIGRMCNVLRKLYAG